ncbi:3-hydroxyacyl-CoA dehydrogenase NAD-binding domain-containing protein [Emcibacter nanhaiensis]|uniref:3-hydroxyacyl-CoA dehydrogenase n=1 Tax=Emcibacter nanhaiensis TaxID=1505037 RepID=A0A501PFR4_9PROT|nr:3-hydroxyacyl-CoA dehydrogenase NAD-binding domain-containing protein [Emcibacter nanhaiensis]TPD59270.1 3-hydroxyacyl-CoA dehydrogenase [Emcibacter nanhaiensis]
MDEFHYAKDSDGIVTVTMDMAGPVNAMNARYSELMGKTLERLEAEEHLTGVIIASAKDTFFAGGDLNELLAVQKGDEETFFADAEKGKGLLRRLEKLPVPVVAAINGAALGGGFEICLSCNRRIAWNDKSVIVGLPEVTLGLLPGAGGVVRLTHLLGFEKALPYLLEGRKVRVGKALRGGLLDDGVDRLENLLPRAKEWILENREKEEAALQPWDRPGHKIPGGDIRSPAVMQVVQVAPIMLLKKTRGLLPAPQRILESATEAVRVDFDTALRIESRNFVSLVTSPVAKNMITAFFFQMNHVNGGGNRPEGYPASSVKKLGIIGAGMMGQGIAYVAAKAGIRVVLKDVNLDQAEKGRDYSARLLDKAIEAGHADEGKKAALLGLIEATDEDAGLSGCDLIVEAVFEDLELKHRINEATEGQLAEEGVWGSNTSTLPITRLAESSAKPDRFIGIHFFSPVDRMPLVELICGAETSDETLARAFDFVRQIRKTPIVVNDSTGFFASRTFGVQLGEASQMVAEGVHPARIEALAKAVGMPVGPLTIYDEISQRLSLKVWETQRNMGLRREADDMTPAGTGVIRTLVEEFDRGGRHYGGGFYDYRDGEKMIWPGLIERYYNPGLEISDRDIMDRLLFSNVIESLKCLEEGVLRSVADGNIGSLLGIGAPAWTGGYIQFVNGYGLKKFRERCNELADLYGERFRAPGVVSEKIAQGELFRQDGSERAK